MEASDTAQPANPEKAGWTQQISPSPAEVLRLQGEASAAFQSVLNGKLPKAFGLAATPTAWLGEHGELKQIRAAANIPRHLFRTSFPVEKWTEVPVPEEYLSLMHLPANTPNNEMACFVGRIKGKPAYVFWSDPAETAMVVVDY